MGSAPEVRLLAGTVVALQDGSMGVNVNGSTPPVWWPAGYIPTPGDVVMVLLVDGQAQVTAPVIEGQRPLTGTVSGAASSGTVPVDTTAGILACRYVGTAPAIGTLVRLDWQATTPWVWPSEAAATPAPPPPSGSAPSKPPASSSGKLYVTALDSGSYNASQGAWSAFQGSNVAQGSNSGTYRGAWFYWGRPRQLAGATITGFRVRLGARLRVGNYNDPLPLQIYLHGNDTRPGGDVTRGAGPAVPVLGPNAPAQWVDLPPDWGQAIVNGGGGLGLAGGPYGGVQGIGAGADPESGQLEFSWRR